MRLGCVIVSDKLPPNRFYKNSPLIQLEHWFDLFTTVQDLMNNQEKMYIISDKTLKWWNDICSPAAMARYTVNLLN
jgi:hypothetical protein